jgi:hypothetical protein
MAMFPSSTRISTLALENIEKSIKNMTYYEMYIKQQ